MTSEIDLTLDLSGSPQEVEAELPTAQFLRIYLTQNQSYLLPIDVLVELAKVPAIQVVPMFCMPPWVVGVYNLRGEVLWIADLNHFLGSSPWYNQTEPTGQHSLVVVRSLEDTFSSDRIPKLGLIVKRITDMVVYPETDIQTNLSSLEPAPMAFTGGVVSGPHGLEQILNIPKILATMTKP